MSFEIYRRVIDQIKDHALFLVFWSWGEPFVNPNAFRMIRYAKDCGLVVHSSTNGHYLNTKERARQLIESGLDSLIFAVDGLNQSSYERYRKGGSLQSVVESIENLVAERSSSGARHPLITFRFIVMKHNEHQISRVREFAERLGVDVVTFRSAVVKRDDINIENSISPVSPYYQLYSSGSVQEGDHPVRQQRLYCHRPYANLTIFSNGDVVSCENDYNSTIPFGNVEQQSLRQILSSAQTKRFFDIFRHSTEQFPFCCSCEYHDMKHHSANIETSVLNKDLYDHAENS
jgi:radical SAM protein with 4Fe4S-binding SPASM domain